MAEQVIVIGGGLAGLSAAHTVLEHGGRVMLLDKCPFLGGNSTKATSGINGALTRTQAKAGIEDSADKFEADIIRGAAGVGHTSAPAHTIPLAKVRDPPPRRGGPRNAASFPKPRAWVARYFNHPRAAPGLRLPCPRSNRAGSRPGKRLVRRLARREVRPGPLAPLAARCAPFRPKPDIAPNPISRVNVLHWTKS